MANEILRKIIADMSIEKKKELLLGLPDSNDVLLRILANMPVEERLAIINREIIQRLFCKMPLEMLKSIPVEKQRQLLKMLQQMLSGEMEPYSESQGEG